MKKIAIIALLPVLSHALQYAKITVTYTSAMVLPTVNTASGKSIFENPAYANSILISSEATDVIESAPNTFYIPLSPEDIKCSMILDRHSKLDFVGGDTADLRHSPYSGNNFVIAGTNGGHGGISPGYITNGDENGNYLMSFYYMVNPTKFLIAHNHEQIGFFDLKCSNSRNTIYDLLPFYITTKQQPPQKSVINANVNNQFFKIQHLYPISIPAYGVTPDGTLNLKYKDKFNISIKNDSVNSQVIHAESTIISNLNTGTNIGYNDQSCWHRGATLNNGGTCKLDLNVSMTADGIIGPDRGVEKQTLISPVRSMLISYNSNNHLSQTMLPFILSIGLLKPINDTGYPLQISSSIKTFSIDKVGASLSSSKNNNIAVINLSNLKFYLRSSYSDSNCTNGFCDASVLFTNDSINKCVDSLQTGVNVVGKVSDENQGSTSSLVSACNLEFKSVPPTNVIYSLYAYYDNNLTAKDGKIYQFLGSFVNSGHISTRAVESGNVALASTSNWGYCYVKPYVSLTQGAAKKIIFDGEDVTQQCKNKGITEQCSVIAGQGKSLHYGETDSRSISITSYDNNTKTTKVKYQCIPRDGIDGGFAIAVKSSAYWDGYDNPNAKYAVKSFDVSGEGVSSHYNSSYNNKLNGMIPTKFTTGLNGQFGTTLNINLSNYLKIGGEEPFSGEVLMRVPLPQSYVVNNPDEEGYKTTNCSVILSYSREKEVSKLKNVQLFCGYRAKTLPFELIKYRWNGADNFVLVIDTLGDMKKYFLSN